MLDILIVFLENNSVVFVHRHLFLWVNLCVLFVQQTWKQRRHGNPSVLSCFYRRGAVAMLTEGKPSKIFLPLFATLEFLNFNGTRGLYKKCRRGSPRRFNEGAEMFLSNLQFKRGRFSCVHHPAFKSNVLTLRTTMKKYCKCIYLDVWNHSCFWHFVISGECLSPSQDQSYWTPSGLYTRFEIIICNWNADCNIRSSTKMRHLHLRILFSLPEDTSPGLLCSHFQWSVTDILLWSSSKSLALDSKTLQQASQTRGSRATSGPPSIYI